MIFQILVFCSAIALGVVLLAVFRRDGSARVIAGILFLCAAFFLADALISGPTVTVVDKRVGDYRIRIERTGW